MNLVVDIVVGKDIGFHFISTDGSFAEAGLRMRCSWRQPVCHYVRPMTGSILVDFTVLRNVAIIKYLQHNTI